MVANNMKLLIKEIKPNPDNPRYIRDEQYKKLVQSIKDFPEMLEKRPIVIDENNMVLGGNMRLKACQDAGLVEVPVSIAENWSEEKKKEFIIKDNIGYGEWDWEKLGNGWEKEQLEEWGMTIDWDEEKLDENYSQKLGEVIYEPKQTNHKISDLYQPETKFDQEIDKLQNEELKGLLKARVYNFYEFNYAKIADYYAYQATPEEQKVIESLALVLLDKDKLIENGFSEIIESITKDEKPNSET